MYIGLLQRGQGGVVIHSAAAFGLCSHATLMKKLGIAAAITIVGASSLFTSAPASARGFYGGGFHGGGFHGGGFRGRGFGIGVGVATGWHWAVWGTDTDTDTDIRPTRITILR